MSLDAKGVLRNWLMRAPQPSIIRLRWEDRDVDNVQEIKVEAKPSWVTHAETILSLEPQRVELVSDTGTIIRADRFDKMASGPARPARAELPAALAGDPHAAMLHHFGTLLAEAHQFATGVAFDKLVEVFELQRDIAQAQQARAESAERLYMQERADRLDEEAERLEEEREAAAEATGGLGDIGQAFMSGLTNGKQEGKPPAKPNGKTTNGKAH